MQHVRRPLMLPRERLAAELQLVEIISIREL
jgi:hypothetical protein